MIRLICHCIIITYGRYRNQPKYKDTTAETDAAIFQGRQLLQTEILLPCAWLP